ncbi:hypothetical protein TrCOL_g3305 [Triparma columacea]|uniref:Methyltransferase type 11 domain-containing protein n=1 Tax=Triparma columacea TaxID=722753 RepID=A0A9W7L9D0_9STRA|nr:hypothetical protein TrCOL_g3305 [Triparma columacea]
MMHLNTTTTLLLLIFILLLHSSNQLSYQSSLPAAGRQSPVTRVLDAPFSDQFPYTKQQLTPEWPDNDRAFYFLPKFVHHASPGCRTQLTNFYSTILPPPSTGATLDLCSSFTSHYPPGYKASKSVALGLNPLELLFNPSKTSFNVHDLNAEPTLPYPSSTFDVCTLALSVDYLTSPLSVFTEIHRVLKPSGLACISFTNRCFPTKVVPIWTNPFTPENHARIVGEYFHHSAEWEEVGVRDLSEEGWEGQKNPMVAVLARKKKDK